MSALPLRRWFARTVLVTGLALAVLTPATALAQSNDNYPPSTTVTTDPCTDGRVCGTSATRVSSASASASNAATLPLTGGDSALLTVLGLATVGGGALLVWLGRRSRSAN